MVRPAAACEELGQLSTQHLIAEVDEGGVVLADGEVEVLLSDEVGSREDAAAALDRAAAVLLARAEDLRREARAQQHWT